MNDFRGRKDGMKEPCGMSPARRVFGKPPVPRASRLLGLLLALMGISLLTTPGIMRLQGLYYGHRLERKWFEYLRRPVENGEIVPFGLRSEETWLLSVPSVGIEAVVVEGVCEHSLSKGTGHVPGTVYPGQPGNCCIAGHRNMYGSCFGQLHQVSVGDNIILRSQDADYAYTVEAKLEVPASHGSALKQTSKPTLTLITCTPCKSERLIVKAGLVKDSGRQSLR